jgi:hypothetical protein
MASDIVIDLLTSSPKTVQNNFYFVVPQLSPTIKPEHFWYCLIRNQVSKKANRKSV